MTNNREKRLEIAGRIYDLDEEVYRILGSGLGRVFNGGREATIRELADVMASHAKGHYLRSEVAQISNMARTIGCTLLCIHFFLLCHPERSEGSVCFYFTHSDSSLCSE